MADLKVAVEIVGQDHLSGPVGTASKGLLGLGDILGKVGLASMGLSTIKDAAMGLANGLRGPIVAASDLSESLNKSNVVFGAAASGIEAFASTAAQGLGQSKAAALAAAGTFGNLFTSLGLGQQPAADLSKKILTLGSDLASFNNIDPGEALEKLRSGLVGESEPLRSLGINLTEAGVKAKAMQMGLADAKGELSESAKVQARYALIVEQSKNAQGDFANTSTGMANAQRIISASFADLQTQIGEQLLPTIAPLIASFAQGMPNAIAAAQPLIQGIGPVFSTIFEVIGNVAHVAMDFAGVLQNLGRYFVAVAEDGDELNDFLSDLPGGFKLVAYVAGTVFSIFRQVADQMRGPLAAAIEVVQRTLGNLAGVFSDDAFFAVQDFVQLVRANLQPILTGLAAILLTVVVPAFLTWAGAAAAAAVSTIIALAPVLIPLAAIAAAVFVLRKAWDEDWGGIQEKTRAAWSFIRPIFDAIQFQLALFWERILPELLLTWDAIRNKVDEAMTFIGRVITTVVSAISAFWEAHWDTISRVLEVTIGIVTRTVEIAFDILAGLFTAGLRALRGDWSGAWDAIQEYSGYIWENLKANFGDTMEILKLTLGAALQHLLNALLGWAGEAWQAMKDAGAQMVAGILAGLAGLADAVKNALTGAVSGALTAAKNLITQNPLTVAVQTATSQVFQSTRPDFGAATSSGGGGGTQITNVQAPGFDWGAYNAIHQGEPRNPDGTVKRQAGGRVFGGWPYRIGEAGSETFVPRTDGYILPHGMAPGAESRPIEVHIHVAGNVVKSQDLAREFYAGLQDLRRKGLVLG